LKRIHLEWKKLENCQRGLLKANNKQCNIHKIEDEKKSSKRAITIKNLHNNIHFYKMKKLNVKTD